MSAGAGAGQPVDDAVPSATGQVQAASAGRDVSGAAQVAPAPTPATPGGSADESVDRKSPGAPGAPGGANRGPGFEGRPPAPGQLVPASGAWREGDPPGHRQFAQLGPIQLERGGAIDVTCAYETWGKLNAARDNAVLVVHALTGDS
ncbi:MAG: hypothetical protein LBO20_07585, partial [Bifidobacteriaceae bacterium]|nr:hypothetical protein [Bifidobacteriaceae bacterium]